MVKIFIAGFPFDVDEIALAQLISPYATVLTVKLVRDKATGKSKGFAFVEVVDEEGANLAIEQLAGKMMGDREISIKIAVEELPKPKVRQHTPKASIQFQSDRPKPQLAERAKRPRRPRI